MTSPPLDYEGQKERGDVAEKYVLILIEEKAALLADNARMREVLEDREAAQSQPLGDAQERSPDLPLSDGEVTWATAPIGETLWGVYGPDCFPTVFACRLRDYPGAGRAIWGFSVYRRQRGFRTLGTGKDWAEKNGLRLFLTRAGAFNHIASLFPPPPSDHVGGEG